jgi:hypothetical protein
MLIIDPKAHIKLKYIAKLSLTKQLQQLSLNCHLTHP